MSKRRFVIPYILLSGGLNDGGEGGVIGGGTGQSGLDLPDAAPCSYAAWVDSFFNDDLDHLGDGPDAYDFADWWMNCGFSRDDWETLNPDLPWDDYFGD